MTDETEPLVHFDEFDERGVKCAQVELRFTGPVFDLAELATRGAITETRNGHPGSSFYLLPEPPTDGATYLACTVHMHEPDPTVAFWNVEYLRMPDPAKRPIPERLRASRFEGVFPNNLLELTRMGRFDGELEITYRLHYLVSDQILAPHFPSHHTGFEVRSRSSVRLSLDIISWAVLGDSEVREITISTSDYDNASWVAVRGSRRGTMNVDTASLLDRAIWDEVSRCALAQT